jgi:hypothetical protein
MTKLAKELKRENEQLKKIIVDIAWMARRYADGRKTYAVGMYNDACFDAVNLGCRIRPDFAEDGKLFARDGMESMENGMFLLDTKYQQFEADYVEKYAAYGNTSSVDRIKGAV